MAVLPRCGENSCEQRRQMRVSRAVVVRGRCLIGLRSITAAQVAGTKAPEREGSCGTLQEHSNTVHGHEPRSLRRNTTTTKPRGTSGLELLGTHVPLRRRLTLRAYIKRYMLLNLKKKEKNYFFSNEVQCSK